jgi:hypothetical protein
MRTGIFFGLMFIADAIYKHGGVSYDLEPLKGFFIFITALCVIQDIISMFKPNSS